MVILQQIKGAKMSENTDKADSVSTPERKSEPKGRNERANSKKAEREYMTEFVDANTRIAVRVQRTQAFRPYYSLVIGRFVEHDNGETFVPYLPVRAEVELAKVQSIQDHTKLVSGLVADATEWIRTKLQEREDEIIASKQAREQRDMDRDKPNARPGLKQLSRIDRIAKAY